MALYDLVILGTPTDEQLEELRSHVSRVVEAFGMRLGEPSVPEDVAWLVRPTMFEPSQRVPGVVVFFGADDADDADVTGLLGSMPVLPVASTSSRVQAEIPPSLQALNCLFLDAHGLPRLSTALLECVGLLPRQRRVFVSYRRDEARGAAVQLFNALSARVFDVFLDTHGVPPAEDFQAMLWHRLCDSDVLLMLDTPTYFKSRWTVAEYGRALAKGMAVLRVGWPGVTPSPRTSTASRVDLSGEDVDSGTGALSEEALERIVDHLEQVRSVGHAVRALNLRSSLRAAVERVGGSVSGVGAYGMHVDLPGQTNVVLCTAVGVPTSFTLEEALEVASGRAVGVVYDHIGLHETWLSHLDWLGTRIPDVRWIRASEAPWEIAGWNLS